MATEDHENDKVEKLEISQRIELLYKQVAESDESIRAHRSDLMLIFSDEDTADMLHDCVRVMVGNQEVLWLSGDTLNVSSDIVEKLMEMEMTEIVELMESPENFQARVQLEMEVLRNFYGELDSTSYLAASKAYFDLLIGCRLQKSSAVEVFKREYSKYSTTKVPPLEQVVAHVPTEVPPHEQATSSNRREFVISSIYVGDLEPTVTIFQLHNLFRQIGNVVSLRICTDHATQRSLGYGYVNYGYPEYAERAVVELNYTILNGKPIRVMHSNRDSRVLRNNAANIFVKYLDKEIDPKSLHRKFSACGDILSCKIATDSSGQSMGYGFVQYAAEGSAKKAIEEFNGMILNGKQVYVGPFLPKQERERLLNETNSTNVYVKNFCESTTEYNLQNIFGEFGEITSKVVMRNEDGTSKCFGFVNFKNADAAARAIESLNGKKIDNKEWYVGIAQRKKDREAMLQHQLVPGMIPNSFVPIVEQIVPRASEISQPIPIGALTSALANASPTEHEKILGDNLYPLVEQLEPEITPRVTGLLLEMDQTEVLHLLESPEALKAAVAAAVEVLKNGAIG